MSQQSVIVTFYHYDGARFGGTDARDLAPLFALEDELTKAIEAAGTGEFDGDVIAVDGSDGQLFMYGPDAEKLFASVERILRASPILDSARVELRFGSVDDAQARTRSVVLGRATP